MQKPSRFYLKKITAAFSLVLSLAFSNVANAQTIVPQFDMEGYWRADPTRQMECFRSIIDVICVMDNANFAHRLELSYVSPTQLSGFYTRKNRISQCITHMSVTVKFISQSSFSLSYVAQDSSCDLIKGIAGIDPTYNKIN